MDEMTFQQLIPPTIIDHLSHTHSLTSIFIPLQNFTAYVTGK